MSRSLQGEFVRSRGAPVQVGCWQVFQCAQIPIKYGLICVTFISENRGDHPTILAQGVEIIPRMKGRVIDSETNDTFNLVELWFEEGSPPQRTFAVDCSDGELMVFNTYVLRHRDGRATVNKITGNAGMTLLSEGIRVRRYGCSHALGEFDPTNLVFEISWRENAGRNGSPSS